MPSPIDGYEHDPAELSAAKTHGKTCPLSVIFTGDVTIEARLAWVPTKFTSVLEPRSSPLASEGDDWDDGIYLH
jgi:hypothetical protein